MIPIHRRRGGSGDQEARWEEDDRQNGPQGLHHLEGGRVWVRNFSQVFWFWRCVILVPLNAHAAFTCDGATLAGSYSGVVAGTDSGTPFSSFVFLDLLSNGTLQLLSVFGEPGLPWQQAAGGRHLVIFFHHRWVLYSFGQPSGRRVIHCQFFG